MHLQLIKPTILDGHPPSVLTVDFRERLARLNAATRELRAMGMKIVWSKLAGPLPQAHIQRDSNISIGPLMDRMGPREFRHVDGATVVSGEFRGVIVSWIEGH